MVVSRSSLVEDFRRDGYVVVRGLLDAARMREIASWVGALAQWSETPGKHMMYFEQSRTEPRRRILSRIENFCPFHPGLQALVNDEAMLGLVSALFGEPAVLFKDKINYKLPGGDGFKAHQDVQAGWDAYASLHITAMLSIDRTTLDNGCLELAPGEHRRGRIGAAWEPMSEADTQGMRFIACPTEPGDAVFFDSFVPHRSAPNGTDEPRRVLYVTYNRVSEGDQRARYYADKRRSYPQDCERDPGKEYVFRV